MKDREKFTIHARYITESNRKLLRSVIRAGVQKQFGQHHVSANMAGNFEKIRKEQVK